MEANMSYLLSCWIALFFGNHLIFKRIVLNRLKKYHPSIWHEMGSPTIFSAKESLWSLIGFTGDIDVMKKLEEENSSLRTISLLKRYRLSTYIEILLMVAVVVFYYVGMST